MKCFGGKSCFAILTSIIVIILIKQKLNIYFNIIYDVLGFSLASVEINQTKFRFAKIYQNEYYIGKVFDLKWNTYLERLDLLSVKLVDTKKVLETKPVIVTAISSSHFIEAKSLFQSIISVYNNTKMVIIYNLGLTDTQLREININYGEVVLEVRQFRFDKYPEYIRNLTEYRWKPLLIAEILMDYHAAWYMDSSVRVLNSLDIVYKDIEKCTDGIEICQTYPWLLVEWTGHSIYSATNPKMFEYLPMPENLSKNLSMYAGGLELIYGLKENKENVLKYWVLCALEKDCMGPVGAYVDCTFTENRWIQYASCHRFDQSAINILLAWITDFQQNKYIHPLASYNLQVVRDENNNETLENSTDMLFQ